MQPNQGQHLQVPGHATPVPHVDSILRDNRLTSQNPQSIKYTKLPDYIPDFKGPKWMNYEEAAFCGAQLLANQSYCSKDPAMHMFLTRSEFNLEGPSAITSQSVGWANMGV
jgi:actin-related protein